MYTYGMDEQPQPLVLPWWRKKKIIIPLSVGVVLLIAAGVTALLTYLQPKDATTQTTTTDTTETETAEEAPEILTTGGLQLDPSKDYGNKYADGILPVGDSKYSTTTAEKGKIYMCHANFVPASQAGAQKRGPWFVNNNTEWDINLKSAIQGSVEWEQKITIELQNGNRVINTNSLPDHHTGVFPVSNSDPARVYDANPNTIQEQALLYTVPAQPAYGTPQCMGGEVGVMITGAALFNGFDAGGRDAGAWEVQDTCDGHPQGDGEYHYHTLSRCIADTSVTKVIGYALDGFPITGPKVGENNILTTDDLDECHGIVSTLTLDGKLVTIYHYVMTQDFPYSASCFRATATDPPRAH
jgi:hypothetical protein